MSTHETASRWLDRSAYLLLAAMIVLPAWMIPRYLHEAVKIGTEYHIVVAAWAVVVVLGAARALEGRSIAAGGEGSWFRRLMIAFVGWLVVSALWAVQPAVHLAYAGSVIALLWAGQAIVGWVDGHPRRRAYVFALLAALLASEAVIGLVQHNHLIGKDLVKYAPPGGFIDGWMHAIGARAARFNVYGTTGNPNYFSELMAVLLVAVTGFAASRKTLALRALVAVPVLAGLFALLYASGRAAAMGLVFGTIAAVVITGAWRSIDLRGWWREPRARMAMIVGLVGLLAVAGFAGGKLYDKFARLKDADTSVESRLVNWKAAVGVWSAKPIQGHGLGGWKRESAAVLAAQNPEGLPESSSGARFVQVHNEPLQGLVELGLIGFLLLLGGLVAWCREVARNEALALPERVGLIAAVLAVLVAAGLGFPFHIPLTALATVVVLALGITTDREAEPATLAPGARWAYALAAVILTGAVGKVVVDRGVAPAYAASENHYYAREVQRKDRKAKGPEVLYAYAADLDRFKAQHTFAAMQVLGSQARYKEIVELYERHKSDGLAMSARLLYGKALLETGRKAEAIAEFQAVAHYYHRSVQNYRVAYKALKKAGVDIPEPIKKKKPTSIVKPASPRPEASEEPAEGAGTDVDGGATDNDNDATGEKGEGDEPSEADASR